MIKKILSILLVFAFLVGACACSGARSSDETMSRPSDESDQYVGQKATVAIEVADYGTITVELEPDKAPGTCANFLKLVNQGFYNGLTFHRIIKGFMIQGGDPEGTGMGGSDKNIYGEFKSNGFKDNDIEHVRGVISMARTGGDMNSASSQFFIVHEDSPHLNGDYAAFGHVVSGMDVVDKIAESVPVQDDNGTVSKADQPVITKVYVVG
ncbi:MAG: peptidylprolyl isomerase [Clostridiales bacterium]|nr:peptidylprolyl isomerase [Clostridiales bacterium]